MLLNRGAALEQAGVEAEGFAAGVEVAGNESAGFGDEAGEAAALGADGVEVVQERFVGFSKFPVGDGQGFEPIDLGLEVCDAEPGGERERDRGLSAREDDDAKQGEEKE